MGAGLARWPGYQAGGLRQLLPWSGVACFLRASLGLHELHQVGESRENEATGRGRHSWSPNTSGQTNQVGGAFPSQPPVAKSIPQEEQWILLQVWS